MKNFKALLTESKMSINDDILDLISFGEIIDTVKSNNPTEKINEAVITKEFNTLMKYRIDDAKHMLKQSMKQLIKDLK